AALDQRAFAPKARRRNRDHALRQRKQLRIVLAGFGGAGFSGFARSDGLVPTHAGMVLKMRAPRNREPGCAKLLSPLSTGGGHVKITSLRQMDAPIVSDLDVGRDHDLPGMAIRVGKISGIAATIRLMR